MDSDPQKEFEMGALAFKAGDATAGAEHLRRAAFAGHAEAQNQLARIYFATTKTRQDIANLEAAARNGDHVALFVLAMSLIDGKILEKDTDKAVAALRLAAEQGNVMAQSMVGATDPS